MDLTYIHNKIIPTKEATISTTSIAFTLGGSVFEALRVNWNEDNNKYYIININNHLNRLFNSLKILRMKIKYTKDDIKEIVSRLVKEWHAKTDGYIRITAYIKDSSSSGSVYHPDDVSTDITISITNKKWDSSINKPIDCCISSWQRISDNSMPPRVKSAANYENTRLAGQEAILNGYDNAILLNQLGKISEAAESVIFFIDQADNLITPSLESDLLNSINRSNIIHIWEKIYKKKVIERFVDRTELYLAKEVFLCNTAKLIRPVLSIDRINIGDGKIGPYTKKVGAEYSKALRGNTTDFIKNSLIIETGI